MKRSACRLDSLAAGLTLLAAASAQASPTANEYTRCHKLVASLVFECLESRPGDAAPACLAPALRSKDRCYARVRAGHQRDLQRIEAEKLQAARKDGG